MFAGKWDHQSERAEGRWNMSRRSKETDCLLHMLGVGNVLSTRNLLVFSFEKLCGDQKQHEPQYLLHGEHENKG